MDFAKKQAVVTVETEKYDEKALLQALQTGGFGGKVVKPATSPAQPPKADQSAKEGEGKKIDPNRQIIVRVQGLT